MKVLIGAACVAVIAFVGYYFWNELAASRQAREVEAGRERARAELFTWAKAEPHEVEKVRDFCKFIADKRYKANDDSELVRILTRNCSGLGYR